MDAPDKNQFPTYMEYLRDITAKLRSENGCPWDREQTHLTLIPYIIEESQEVVDALLRSDDEHLKEELGDLLFQVTLHSQIAAERGSFHFEDVAKDVAEKLILRHPHVFESKDHSLKTASDVVENWDSLKQKEKEKRGRAPELKRTQKGASILSGVPETFPSLLKAEKFQKKAAKAGFDWKDIKGVEEKLREELEEFISEINVRSEVTTNQIRMEEELGDLLFTIVNLARKLGLSSESALTRTNSKFKKRIELMEMECSRKGLSFSELSLEALDQMWDQAKNELDSHKIQNPLIEQSKQSQILIDQLFSVLYFKDVGQEDWPKRFEFSLASDEFEAIFSSMGSFTIVPLRPVLGTRSQPIFYLNLNKTDKGGWDWVDLDENHFSDLSEILEAIRDSIKKYTAHLKNKLE
ncbi:nucleoside triphosphate pyrophosphohydrolase [Leptospira perolatii]|uniref:Nucleoside triphosphate pyrophosphohydrolase n=1 Tax=Leptospira perolatii TaxID=2023191 RepID=A0A2M9ZKU0_9LEPT|nr:nucleoside triphosphate pyrophosphohydrolase [Leptospira perolatii]PJZ69905.1 nucleoside triphosphate pyrophosphohydrolase [Leptospira perolatii]PJZ72687.1 nucleoside triphosphate pyrophosphohydrolase [Leptospira perolatii]